MKKNLRIVSAAAAALLSVAPVAATVVSTVSASAQTTPVTKVQNGLNYDAVVNKNDAWVFLLEMKMVIGITQRMLHLPKRLRSKLLTATLL